jgi:hypothetical protein
MNEIWLLMKFEIHQNRDYKLIYNSDYTDNTILHDIQQR